MSELELLLVRHGRAEEREVFARTGRADTERPLTDEGRERMAAGARGLRRVYPELEQVVTSPLVRAQQTAAFLAHVYGINPLEDARLAPGMVAEELLVWLRTLGARRIALVGHEPDLGLFAAWLLAGPGHEFAPLKKGAATLIRLEHAAGMGEGRLQWALTPKQLRWLGAGA